MADSLGGSMTTITTKTLRGMADGKKSESLGRGAGTLMFWKRGERTRVFFRYTDPDGKQQDRPIGLYDEGGKAGLTLAQARDKARELSKLYQSGVKDIRAHFAEQEATKKAEKEAQQAAQEAARREQEARDRYTLGALCDAYVSHLEALGKPSAKDAACAFRVHVAGASPDLANTPAAEVGPEQIADLIRSIRDKGKDRMAGVVRSYLSAAYQQAIGARFDTGASASFNGFGVTQNPVAPIKAVSVKAGQRTLSLSELRDYLNRLGDGIVDQALTLALLAGGQRMAQLLRARVGDWDTEQQTLRLWDSKGKRKAAREHLLPLGPEGSALVERLIERAREKAAEAGDQRPNPNLWLSVGGAEVADTTPGKRCRQISEEMGGEAFDLRDIRRTVETQLAGLGISRDVRANLLSHGLGGVQAVHYDRHDYINEKRSALVAWESHLLEQASRKVVPIRQSA
jgi:integrase